MRERKKKAVAIIEQQKAEETAKRVIEEKISKALIQGKLSVNDIAGLFEVLVEYVEHLARK